MRMKSRFVIPLAACVLMILACTGEQKLGELSVGATAEPVRLKGETNHVWFVDVESGVQYQIVVTSRTLVHPLENIEIVVFGDDRTNIATPISIANGLAKVTFIGPNGGQVRIEIYSLIGERQEDLGEVEVRLEKLSP